MTHEQKDVATAGDFHRAAAKRWLDIPGIVHLPEFHKICQEIVENDEVWRQENWSRIGEIEGSSEVRSFLTEREGGKSLDPESRCWKAYVGVLARAESLGRLGWTLPMNVDIATLRQFHLLTSRPDLTAGEIEQWFTHYYRSRGLPHAVAGLLSAHGLSFWRPLLEQCLRAYERGEYQICLPSLLLIFEGAIARPWGVAFQSSRGRNRFFERKIAGTADNWQEQQMWKSLRVFAEQIFEAGASASRNYAAPKRHLILHGKSDPSTWNEADCLRLFHAINTVVDLRVVSRINELRTEGR